MGLLIDGLLLKGVIPADDPPHVINAREIAPVIARDWQYIEA